jgi:branched-chain amino acid aminotransferase
MEMDIDIELERTNNPRPRPTDENYGFGRYFTDHMFMVDYSGVLGWHAPRVVPYQSLRLDPGASVLHYGQALFEGMKAFRGDDGKVRMFRPEANWKRMKAGAERLCMQLPDLDVFLEGMLRLVRTDLDWVPTKAGTALYLRPTLIGSEAFLGVRPSESFVFYVIACPVGGYYSGLAGGRDGENIEPVKIWIERTFSRAAPGGMGAVKAGGNYAASLLAATEAKKRGYSQVLWLDASEKKFVEEVGTMNVFFKIKDTLVTPPLTGTILPGVTRQSVIDLARHQGIALEERPISVDEVLRAHSTGDLKEVFGTGTAASISPVGGFGLEDGSGVKTIAINDGKAGETSLALQKILQDIQYGRSKDEFGWTMLC